MVMRTFTYGSIAESVVVELVTVKVSETRTISRLDKIAMIPKTPLRFFATVSSLTCPSLVIVWSDSWIESIFYPRSLQAKSRTA